MAERRGDKLQCGADETSHCCIGRSEIVAFLDVFLPQIDSARVLLRQREEMDDGTAGVLSNPHAAPRLKEDP